jgi:hypothetical protein
MRPDRSKEVALAHRLLAAFLGLGALLLGAAPAFAQDPDQIQVQLADGSSLLLRSWALTYEYQSSRRGEGAALGGTARREARDLWIGKKVVPLAGQALELQYADAMQEVDGQAVKVQVARGFVLVAKDGKRSTLKPDPPHPDLLLPDAEGRLVQARSLDLRGETIGGTRREFCLMSYSPYVQCASAADQRVVKLQVRP